MPTDPFAPIASADSPPAAQGFQMPPEWAEHQCTWLSWPHNTETWPDGRLQAVEDALATAVRALATGEAVRINVLDETHEAHVRDRIGTPDTAYPILYHHIPTNDAWCRDHGATFVTRASQTPSLAAIDWTYNAWGDKYPPYDRDAKVARRMAETLEVPRFATDLVAEGGALEIGEDGLLLTTSSCLLNENRNPNWSRREVESTLRDLLGAREVHWLPGAELVGDDTDGHVDNLVRFGPENTIFVATEDDPADANFSSLDRLRTRVEHIAADRGCTVVPLPLPDPVIVDGTRLPASYANFYIGNEVVLLPCFDDPADASARDALRDVFSGREVIGIDATAIAWGLGTLHCLTQQVPAVATEQTKSLSSSEKSAPHP